MRAFRRLVYLAYYMRKMDWPLFRRFMAYTKQTEGVSYSSQCVAMMKSCLKYNISPLEYYQFRFSKQPDSERATWAGTGTMYEFQLQANPPKFRDVLNDKRKFYRAYHRFFRHQMFTSEELSKSRALCESLLEDNRKLVFKSATGKCGKNVRIESANDFNPGSLIRFMSQNEYDLVETYIQQHPSLHRLSPSAVNTVRVFTMMSAKDGFVILGCRLRISVNSSVDNMAAGNLAAPINTQTGVVDGPAVYSDISKPSESVHPITGVSIIGFQIPFWEETLAMVEEASRLRPENRSVGWDIVITENGPGLIEGNHDWCKLVWQLPVKKGLKHLLTREIR